MLTKVSVLSVALLLLAGCQAKSLLPGDEPTAANFQVKTVQFQRSDGERCPSSPDATLENMRCAVIKLSYPEITAAGSPAAVSQLNQFIQAQLLEYSDDTGKQPGTPDELADIFINEYQQVPDNFGSWEMERNITVSFSNDKVATLNYTEYGYTGGAHPFSGQSYFVMDITSGQQLTLNNLLASGYETELNTAGEQAFREAREIPAGNSLEDAGFWFENNTFKLNTNFGALKDGMVFVFNPYEVAPYALGSTEFIIPWQAIRNLVPTNSPLTTVVQ